MLITYLKLVNFKRFPLRTTELFEHHFTSKLLMIIGANGSGKSSLLYELTPLPSAKEAFHKNGYKQINITHEGHSFVLVCDFTISAKYSFLMNGEELNVSGNVTAQKDLVQTHFNITPAIHDILTGAENFTDMTLLARKKLFSSITHLNIDAILENYNHLKDELKLSEYTLKSQLQLAQAEEQKLLNPTHLEELHTKLKENKAHMDFLLDLRSTLSKATSPIAQECESLAALQARLKALKQKYHVLLTAHPYDRLEALVLDYTSEIALTAYKLSEAYSELEQLSEQLKTIELGRQTSAQTVQTELSHTLQSKAQLFESLDILSPEYAPSSTSEQALYKMEVTLLDVVSDIPLNTDGKYSTDTYNKAVNYKAEKLEFITKTLHEESKLQRHLEHLLSHKDKLQECPRCSHTWSTVYTEADETKTRQTLQTLEEAKTQAQLLVKSLNETIESIQAYYVLYKQYTTLRALTYEDFKAFWVTAAERNLIFHEPKALLALFKSLCRDVATLKEVKALTTHTVKLEETLAALAKVKDVNVAAIQSKAYELTQSVQELLTAKQAVELQLKYLNASKSVYSAIQTVEQAMLPAIANVQSHNLSIALGKVISTIDDELRLHKLSLIEMDAEVAKYNSVKYTLEAYKANITEAQENTKLLELILEELSPKTGIIAKSVSSFLNVIISGINSVIESIWEYKMQLKVIDIDSESLNYKFKLLVDDKPNADDIAKSSSGMKEVINLSFRLVVYKLLELGNYPFYADEFGVRLDSVHRSKISTLIFKLIASTRHSQIFLITHMDMSYSLFKDVEVLELD